MSGPLCTAIHQISRHTTTIKTTLRDTLPASPMLSQATKTRLIEGGVAITTVARIAECQGPAPVLHFRRKVAVVVAQRLHNSRTCRGHQHLAQEVVDLPQKHLVRIHLQYKHLPSLHQSMLMTILSARRKTCGWRMRGRKRIARCRHPRRPLLVLQHNPNLASASH